MKLPVVYDKLSSNGRRAVRAEYVRQQKNKCWYCEEDLFQEPVKIREKYTKINLKNFPEGFLDKPIHLQHNHNTGLTEGAVHAYCNAVLWEYFQR